VAHRCAAVFSRAPPPRGGAAPRRKAETLRLARMAARRMMVISSVLEIEIEG